MAPGAHIACSRRGGDAWQYVIESILAESLWRLSANRIHIADLVFLRNAGASFW